MRFLPVVPLLLLSACDAVEEDLPGTLVQVEVVATADDCRPARFTGDAGVHFFGVREDGGLVFTMAVNAQYGPTVDGGVLESVQRQLPSAARVAVGDGAGCEGVFSNWERTVDGVRLAQEWPGGDTCPRGPIWLPFKACVSTRTYVFTEVGTCPLRCVKISPASGEVACTC